MYSFVGRFILLRKSTVADEFLLQLQGSAAVRRRGAISATTADKLVRCCLVKASFFYWNKVVAPLFEHLEFSEFKRWKWLMVVARVGCGVSIHYGSMLSVDGNIKNHGGRKGWPTSV
jgi:hypothetical protein